MTKNQLDEIEREMGKAFYKDVLELEEENRKLKTIGDKMWNNYFFRLKSESINDLPFHEWSDMAAKSKSIFTCPDCCVDPCRCDLEDICRIRRERMAELEFEVAATQQVADRQRERAKEAERVVDSLQSIINTSSAPIGKWQELNERVQKLIDIGNAMSEHVRHHGCNFRSSNPECECGALDSFKAWKELVDNGIVEE